MSLLFLTDGGPAQSCLGLEGLLVEELVSITVVEELVSITVVEELQPVKLVNEVVCWMTVEDMKRWGSCGTQAPEIVEELPPFLRQLCEDFTIDLTKCILE